MQYLCRIDIMQEVYNNTGADSLKILIYLRIKFQLVLHETVT